MPYRMAQSRGRSRSFLTFVCTPFELEGDGATCPPLLCHITLQLLGNFLELAQELNLIFEWIKSSVGKFQYNCGGSSSSLIDLAIPLGTNAFSFFPDPGFHHIRVDAQVRAEQRSHAKFLVHEQHCGTMCVHIPACLESHKHV